MATLFAVLACEKGRIFTRNPHWGKTSFNDNKGGCFDDEYVGYGNNGMPLVNDYSFVMLAQELRKLIPNKIISFYFIGPASQNQEWNRDCIGNHVDYSCLLWNVFGSRCSHIRSRKASGLNRTYVNYNFHVVCFT
ncbi:hypothetical protein OOZ15_16895 [Galbibacter sp. EGI 63066]|uniref:hypothetical protein n=1 Tax=Galbibacter sp. EGI 63066 TaxID=2993559 RepID=UPI00224890A7|nr:hypothetical protein [Galbibacter sp. EGI 63066]MCX2681632.1 hypothetical protein [Galbibacter sp. EGI 63066]